jgi:cyclase
LAIDAKKTDKGWEVYVNGGRTPVGLDALEWAKEGARLGCGEILLTSMDYDGTKDGYDLELTKAISSAVTIPVIASGGAGSLEHFYDCFAKTGADAALAASLFHYGTYSIKQVKEYLKGRGIPVRL